MRELPVFRQTGNWEGSPGSTGAAGQSDGIRTVAL